MSRVHTSRALIPRLSKDNNELEFWTTCGPADEFDPVVSGVSGTWYMDDGYTEYVASGANLSGGHYHFASEGSHRAIFKPAGGRLAAITGIVANIDKLTQIRNIEKCSLTTVNVSENASLNIQTYLLRNVSFSIYVYDCSQLIGDVSGLNPLLRILSISIGNVVGDIANLPTTLTSLYCSECPNISGSISNFPDGLQTCYAYSNDGIVAGSIAHLTAVQDIRIYSMGWLAADVDTVLLSISDAIHADVNHFTYATPALNIGGTNEAPGGTAAAATTSPLVTPGSGNTDSDWLWDAGAGKHKALTGMAAIYVMRNCVGHSWTVTATGVA